MKIMRYATLLLIAATCFAKSGLMTYPIYESITEGTPMGELEGCIGKPFSSCRVDDETEELKYVERFNVGAELTTENHYYLTIRNGAVIAKRMVYITPPAYDLIYKEDPNNLVN